MAVLKRFRGKTRVGARHAAGRPQKTRWQPRVEWLERRDLLAALDGTNQPPVAVDDLLTTAQGVPLVFSAEQLLQNDHDADGDALRVTLLAGSGPAHGSLQLTPDGRYVYVPSRDFTGEDRFQYFAWDGQAFSAAATVVLRVVPPTPPPLARPDQYSTLVDTPLTVPAPGVLGNDVAPDGQTLVAGLVRGPAHGTLTLAADGSFSYVPAAGFVGVDTFLYQARIADSTLPLQSTMNAAPSDLVPPGGLALVTITVHPRETGIIAGDDFYTTPQGTKLQVAAPGVLANDRAPTTVLLQAVLLEGPAHGKLELAADGSFVYVPAGDFRGIDQFRYRAVVFNTQPGTPATLTAASGATGTGNAPADPSQPRTPDRDDVGLVTIYVRPAVPFPIAQDDVYTTEPAATLDVPAPGVLGNDKAPPGQTLAALLVSQPAHGQLELRPDGSFVYVPDADFVGTDTFTYQAQLVPSPLASPSTLLGSVAGATSSLLGQTDNPPGTRPVPWPGDVARVTIVVRPAAPPVIAVPDRYVTKKDQPLDVAAPGVLANDRAPTDVLSAALVTPPAHGTLSLNADGSFRYEPAEGFVGEDTFVYRATAGGGGGNADGGSTGGSTGDPAGAATATLGHLPPDPAVAKVTILVLGEKVPPVVILPRLATSDESGPQVVSGFAAPTAVAGPDGLSLPPLQLIVDRPELFATLPRVDANGRLVYAPAPNSQGQAVVEVRIGEGTQAQSVGQLTIQVTKPRPLYNVVRPRDVTADGVVSPIDALLVINYLNSGGRPDAAASGEGMVGYYLDVNGDNFVSPIDALLVINDLNSRQEGAATSANLAEGESAAAAQASPSAPSGDASLDELITWLALDTATAGGQRRK